MQVENLMGVYKIILQYLHSQLIFLMSNISIYIFCYLIYYYSTKIMEHSPFFIVEVNIVKKYYGYIY